MTPLKLWDVAKAQREFEGYIGIEIEKRYKKLTNEPYTSSDIRYTELSRTSKALYLKKDDPTPLFHLLHMGGGFIGGEKFRTDIIVKDNTHGIFTSQSAAKIYKVKEKGVPSFYWVNVEIGENSTMEFINDSVILYPTAEYLQYNVFNLRSTSTFFYSEVFSPGYAQNGGKYEYTEMLLNTKLYIDGRLALFDNLDFEPKSNDPSKFGVMDGYDRCGTAFYISPKITEDLAEELRTLVKEQCSDIDHELGISNFISTGVGVRVLANETYEIQRILMLIHNYLRDKILGLENLDLRKC
ncbi:urease accessory protein UreD [Ureaplasma ceti]|uniref:Urease accessory protein UreD n=1 Tax=Ureaplasma ceti TaxID=3119530 RepID=A0ABP9U777_9BACT